MSLELNDIKKIIEKDFTYNIDARERAANDFIFFCVTQWDDSFLSESSLQYRGEFDILRKAARQILSDLATNKIQVDFEPKDEQRTDSAELIDGLYRSDDNNNSSVEAYSNAKQETVICGVGAWELYTEYESIRSSNKNQCIRRRPIFEAYNTVVWDSNAKLLDKSDANRCTLLKPYSEDGYKSLVNELTGEEIDKINPSNFKIPDGRNTFQWFNSSGKKVYVCEFYYKEKVKDKILLMADPFGEITELYESSLVNVMDDMIDQGYTIDSEKKVERYRVTKYILSGEKILSEDIIPGEHIPVIPEYGERYIIEGEEYSEGVTRLAKDACRLRNFQMSYLADIVSKGPRSKPIFWPEQIAGFKDMYEVSGIDNNYPYLLMNRKDGTGNDLPLGPVSVIPDTPIPQALIASIQLSREAVEDVANPGVPQDIADPDLSGKAVNALTARLDMQSLYFQENFKHAKRRDAEVYASMAAEIHDVPKKVKLTMPDGSTKYAEIMQSVIDSETGQIVVLNNLLNVEFDVYSKIGTSYTSQKEQTLERLMEMQGGFVPGDPMGKALQLKTLALMDGVDFDDIKEYANKQLVLSGIRKPETSEEEQMLAEAQNAPKEPNADMALAMAEMEKAKALQFEAQIKQIQTQLDAQNESMKRQVDYFKAETDRMKLQVTAQEAGAKINNIDSDTVGKDLENASKIIELQKPVPLSEMSNDDLFKMLQTG